MTTPEMPSDPALAPPQLAGGRPLLVIAYSDDGSEGVDPDSDPITGIVSDQPHHVANLASAWGRQGRTFWVLRVAAGRAAWITPDALAAEAGRRG